VLNSKSGAVAFTASAGESMLFCSSCALSEATERVCAKSIVNHHFEPGQPHPATSPRGNGHTRPTRSYGFLRAFHPWVVLLTRMAFTDRSCIVFVDQSCKPARIRSRSFSLFPKDPSGNFSLSRQPAATSTLPYAQRPCNPVRSRHWVCEGLTCGCGEVPDREKAEWVAKKTK